MCRARWSILGTCSPFVSRSVSGVEIWYAVFEVLGRELESGNRKAYVVR